MYLDSSGNLGLGVTPSGWGSTFKALQGGAGSLWSYSTSGFGFTANAYNNSGWKYVNNGYANSFETDTGKFIWYNAPSGTAGNAISFTQAMTLDASGNLGIGTTSPSARLSLSGSSAASIATFTDGTVTGELFFGAVGYSSFQLGTSNAYPLTFYTNNAIRMTIESDGSVFQQQNAPAAVNTTATLTVANLQTRIITSTTAAAVTGTLPTGTLMDGWYSTLPNMAVDWTVINTGATNAFTVAAGTGHTVVGNMTVAASSTSLFRSRRTAANTWVTYRVG
jgi:hypothetical protein